MQCLVGHNSAKVFDKNIVRLAFFFYKSTCLLKVFLET